MSDAVGENIECVCTWLETCLMDPEYCLEICEPVEEHHLVSFTRVYIPALKVYAIRQKHEVLLRDDTSYFITLFKVERRFLSESLFTETGVKIFDVSYETLEKEQVDYVITVKIAGADSDAICDILYAKIDDLLVDLDETYHFKSDLDVD